MSDPKSRIKTYYKFKHYALQKDNRTMEELCSDTDEFKLQTQQKFLRDWSDLNPSWKNLLMYHEIGSGKTCTSITLAEHYMEQNPTHKVTVILPARLKTNFFDELISPCGFGKYISQEEFVTYNDSKTSQSLRKKIRKRFMSKIGERYDIMSFEKFKSLAEKSPNLGVWVKMLTTHRMVIIDEVHNLLNMKYNPTKYQELVSTKAIPKKVGGVGTMLFKYLTSHADETCKFVFMTATPIFDNISQFKALVNIVNPSSQDKLTDLKGAIEYLRGHVSYFPGLSPRAYPMKDYIEEEVLLSKTQEQITKRIIDSNSDPDDEDKEAFLVKQRQVAIACLPKNVEITNDNVKRVLKNLDEYAPKLKHINNNIHDHPGKHLVFSNFIKHGLKVLEQLLRSKGWVSIKEIIKDSSLRSKYEFKVYAIWDGGVSDADKQIIKSIVNNKNNIDGKHLRVVLGSPSIKEGVSFKHIQHVHLLDPVWNQSAKNQVEGRAIRFCSHIDIPKDHPVLKRKVVIHAYKIIRRKNSIISETCDERIYDTIIPKKAKLVKTAENALKNVAIDHFLFRNLYQPTQKSPALQKTKSLIEIPENIDLLKKPKLKEKTTCPSKRRPHVQTGLCEEGMEKRINKQGYPCCFKIKKPKTEKNIGCPKDRQPVDNTCKDGYEVRTNKHGSICCYKVRKTLKK